MGAVYAQPLVIGGTTVVTTEKAYAYGVNATTGAIVWSRSFGTPFLSKTIGCSDLTPTLGSTSTPVEDPSTGLVYLTTRLETGKGGIANAHWYLQAVSATTGAEAPGYPVQLTGTPSDTPGVSFADATAQQRPGLLLLGGTVYAAFASDCDITPYRGVVIGVSTTSHAVTTMWSDESGIGTDQSSMAGIWESGDGLVSLGPNNIVLATGNGVSPTPAPSGSPPATLSESLVGLTVGPTGTLTPTQFFAPANSANLDATDDDFGAGGPAALPTAYFGTPAHPQLLVHAGKDGRVFLVDAANMGGFEQGPGGGDAVLQELGPYVGVWGHPAVYGGQGGWVYVLENGGGGYLRAYAYGTNGSGVPQLTPAGTSSGTFGYTSGSPMVTSNGTTAGSTVVWAVSVSGPRGTRGQLRAYGAIPSAGVLPLLWSAPIGTASKFSVPTAWNGHVLVGTRTGRLIGFGPTTAGAVTAAPLAFGSVPVGTSKTLTLAATATQATTVTGTADVSGYQASTRPGPRPRAPRAGPRRPRPPPPGRRPGPPRSRRRAPRRYRGACSPSPALRSAPVWPPARPSPSGSRSPRRDRGRSSPT